MRKSNHSFDLRSLPSGLRKSDLMKPALFAGPSDRLYEENTTFPALLTRPALFQAVEILATRAWPCLYVIKLSNLIITEKSGRVFISSKRASPPHVIRSLATILAFTIAFPCKAIHFCHCLKYLVYVKKTRKACCFFLLNC